jgi:hypothetical protein
MLSQSGRMYRSHTDRISDHIQMYRTAVRVSESERG